MPLRMNAVLSGLAAVGFERGQRRDGGAQHVHRVSRLRGADDREHLFGQGAGGLEIGVETGKLDLGRQLAMDQEIGDLLEAGMLREVVDRVAAIGKLPLAAVDMGGPGAFEIDALEATVDLDVIGHSGLLTAYAEVYMSLLEKVHRLARTKNARVVFPESDDARVAEAARRLADEGVCQPVALARPSPAQVAALVRARGMKETVARRLLNRPLYRAAAMVAAGEADVMVAGAASPSRRVVEAAAMAIGPADGVATPSSFFVMVFPDGRTLLFADCAVVVSPDAAQLADIARASEVSARALLGRADVALLSYATGASGVGASVERVREAARLSGFAGPVQADAALNPEIARRKGMTGQTPFNVLIFPDLDAGNIAYKLVRELAGAQALGPILQGFRHPVCDLSRSASVDDIVAATALTIAAWAGDDQAAFSA